MNIIQILAKAGDYFFRLLQTILNNPTTAIGYAIAFVIVVSILTFLVNKFK